MRSIEDIGETGAAWVTEAELAMLCAFAKRAEKAEAKLARVVEAITNEECDPPAAATTVQEQGFWSAGVATLRSRLLSAAKGQRVICDTHHTGGGMYYKDECPSCLAAAKEE